MAHRAIGWSASRDLDYDVMRWLVLLAAIGTVALALRWWLLATRQSRQRGAKDRATVERSPSARDRLLALAAWPVFMVMVASAIVLGLIAGMLVGRN